MILRREFPSYEDYVYAQGGKARRNRAELLASMPKRVRVFEELFRQAKPHLQKGAVLCLGARTGAEMLGAAAAGFAGSVGIDLHPVGKGVRAGDWHCMPEFADGSFPNIYTNSFDHCLYLEKACAEVLRILAPRGCFYLMASDKGDKSQQKEIDKWKASTKHNEAIFWSRSEELRDAVLALGFKERRSWRSGCWGHFILGRS